MYTPPRCNKRLISLPSYASLPKPRRVTLCLFSPLVFIYYTSLYVSLVRGVYSLKLKKKGRYKFRR
jgi:hypothetical protein